MRRVIPALVISILALELVSISHASPINDTRRIGTSLRSVPVPTPSNLGDFVKDKTAAIALGKALFWDMQAGGDGRVACASCHFQAGADSRSKNQLNPGANHGFNTGGANHQLTAADFPFHQLATPDDARSQVIRSMDDVVGSQGVHNTAFTDIILGGAADARVSQPDADGFSVNGQNVRRVTGRNTPPVINAVFNVRNFWDGRANNMFNGRNPFGAADANAQVLQANALGQCSATHILLDNASLASQAVGPPNNPTEMSAAGRTWFKLGKKMLSLRPLDGQHVATDDGVLGSMAISGGTGLATSYADLVRAAFQDKWWNSDAVVDASMQTIPGMNSASSLTTDQFSMMEANFSMYWGLAVMLYESTLVSDDSPFDRYLDGNDNALTSSQKAGFGTFQSKCASCHSGAELSSATFSATLAGTRAEGLVKRMQMADGHTALYDGGFYNIGIRPTGEDIGVGGSNPFGDPLSVSKRALLNAGTPGVMLSPPASAGESVAVDGAFKVPILLNVELTGPYFHNGSAGSLLEVVQFYTRGGNFSAQNSANLDPRIEEIGKLKGKLSAQMQVVDFLTSLTDDRVRYYQAPFDHPELVVASGSAGSELSVLADFGMAGQAADDIIVLPATGRHGQSTPIASFLGIATASSLVMMPGGETISQSGSTDGETSFSLVQASPNPVSARTTVRIGFSLAIAGDVELLVFDITGRQVRTLARTSFAAGQHSVAWDGTSDSGTRLPKGVYLYRLRSGAQSIERKLIVID